MLPAALVAIGISFAAPTTANEITIAGLTPYQRPDGAPAIRTIAHDDAWRARALHGVVGPAPESLKWLHDQGAWYTPFNRPGMTGYYDIRGWHSRPPTPKTEKNTP